ncbi:hypothetical protein [Streptomyces sp. NPDC040750]|uniref:hypothetical protein n=1 Tax=Streptomyces sp. NPDC040750 TaxID=3154491 RepID=UPI0033C59F37
MSGHRNGRPGGIDPAAYGGVWTDFLDQADRVLLTRVEEAAAAGEDGPLQSMLATAHSGPD